MSSGSDANSKLLLMCDQCGCNCTSFSPRSWACTVVSRATRVGKALVARVDGEVTYGLALPPKKVADLDPNLPSRFIVMVVKVGFMENVMKNAAISRVQLNSSVRRGAVSQRLGAAGRELRVAGEAATPLLTVAAAASRQPTNLHHQLAASKFQASSKPSVTSRPVTTSAAQPQVLSMSQSQPGAAVGDSSTAPASTLKFLKLKLI